LNTRLSQPRWINLGAIAAVAIAVLYLFFWPGPEGLPFIKVGIPQRTIVLETTITGLNDKDVLSTLRQGDVVKVSINNAPRIQMKLGSIEKLPTTVAVTQPKGLVKAQPDPRPEMRFGNNLLVRLEGKGYSNNRGTFLGLKRARAASTIKIYSPGFETPASIVNVLVKPS
jgi:Domain of unknown function (DUF4330)